MQYIVPQCLAYSLYQPCWTHQIKLGMMVRNTLHGLHKVSYIVGFKHLPCTQEDVGLNTILAAFAKCLNDWHCSVSLQVPVNRYILYQSEMCTILPLPLLKLNAMVFCFVLETY